MLPRRRMLLLRSLCAFTAVATVGAAAEACLTVSPPPLPVSSPTRPVILHDAVVPTAAVPLVDWPGDNEFLVPVEVDTPGEAFVYDVFVDYDPTANGNQGSFPAILPRSVTPTPDSLDGGIYTVSFALAPPDPRFCHTVEFVVAHAFDNMSLHTPDSVGGDIVSWFYSAGVVNGCPEWDAGAFQNGAFDAAADVTVFGTSGSP